MTKMDSKKTMINKRAFKKLLRMKRKKYILVQRVFPCMFQELFENHTNAKEYNGKCRQHARTAAQWKF